MKSSLDVIVKNNFHLSNIKDIDLNMSINIRSVLLIRFQSVSALFPSYNKVTSKAEKVTITYIDKLNCALIIALSSNQL